MKLDGLTRLDLPRIEAALRAAEPVEVQLHGRFPRWIRADELIPLFDRIEARVPNLAETLALHLPPAARPGPGPKVTAVIPTHRQTPIGLGALRGQDCELDVLVVANGKAHPDGDRVVRLDWQGHGATRQRGVEEATGDYILFTVDDALPRGRGCVRALVDALEEGGYDAVFGRQLPWPTSDPVTRARLRAWTPPGLGHRRVERHDHVFALYRRQTLLESPLPSVPIGEDLHWAQGRRIGYVPGAPVVHAHERLPGELFARTRDLHMQHIATGEAPRVPDLGALVRALPGVVQPTLQAGPRELPNQLAELFGQWRAARKSAKKGTDQGPS